MIEGMGWAIATLGGIVCVIGSIGLIRLPDALSRLHALTKVDNVGLGLCLLGAVLVAQNGAFALRALLVWFFLLIGSAAGSYVLAHYIVRNRP